MLFGSMASLPFFNSTNADWKGKEQIVENLMKENLEGNKSSEIAGIYSGLNMINNDNNSK